MTAKQNPLNAAALALSPERQQMDALVEFLETHHPDLTRDPAWQTFAGLACEFASDAVSAAPPPSDSKGGITHATQI